MPPKCVCSERGNGAQRNDLAVAEAELPTVGEAYTDPVMCHFYLYQFINSNVFIHSSNTDKYFSDTISKALQVIT